MTFRELCTYLEGMHMPSDWDDLQVFTSVQDADGHVIHGVPIRDVLCDTSMRGDADVPHQIPITQYPCDCPKPTKPTDA